ncbi:hypothetical protein Acr_13g0003550 [Actinidia rufa]|uniref:Uncharacterized protein n=1 Tax=Actinidia rufa TaxID=165716 RepID=A0A7J0FJS5_9ERIC|nr:hypothetical protein Acr_13g0003550 [Actinidia rufa]
MLMRQTEKTFSAKDLLCVYTVVQTKKEPSTPLLFRDNGLRSFPRFNGRLPYNFNDRFKRKSDNCKKAIHAVNNIKVPRKVSDVLQYEPIYGHVIPHKVEEDIKISHPSLRIEERAPQCDASSSERSKAPPSTNPPTIPAQDWEEAYTDTYFCYCADFNDRFKRRSGNCKKAIHTVNNKKAQGSHPSLRIEERAPRCDVSISERSKAPPSANPPTIPAQAWEEHLTSSSSTYVSPESSDSEEEGEKAPAREVKIVHYFREAHNSGTSSVDNKLVRFRTLGQQQKKTTLATNSPATATPPIRQVPHLVVDPILELANTVMGRSRRRTERTSSALHPSSNADAELWKPEFAIVELDRQITVAISTKDHDTSLALARAIMLPKDITDLAEKSSDAIKGSDGDRVAAISDRMKDQLSRAEAIQQKVGQPGIRTEQGKARTICCRQAGEQTWLLLNRPEMPAELQAIACGVYERVFNRAINRARDNYDRQVAEHCPRIYMKGWLACLAEFGIPEDNPACLMRRMVKKALANEVAHPTVEAAQPVEEAEKIATDESGGDAPQDPSLEP